MLKNKPVGLQHIGLPVSDAANSRAFYSELGFDSIESKIMPDGTAVEMMQLGNCVIELYQKPSSQEDRSDGRIDHFALQVEDAAAAYAECVEKGYRMLTDGVQDMDIWQNGARFFIFAGPDGERVEFHEVVK